MDEGDALAGNELVGDEGRGASGSKEEHEAWVVFLSCKAGEVEEADNFARLGHAAETQTKGKGWRSGRGVDNLEKVRNASW